MEREILKKATAFFAKEHASRDEIDEISRIQAVASAPSADPGG